MTVEQTHMVFGALDLKIEMAEKNARAFKERAPVLDQTEALIRQKIEILEKELRSIQQRKEFNPTMANKADEEVAALRRVRAACEQDPRVADAVWIKLLLDRKKS